MSSCSKVQMRYCRCLLYWRFSHCKKQAFRRIHSLLTVRHSLCAEYCSNMKLEKTKKGVRLTKEKREFYQGMYDYLTKPTYNGYFD